jgi:hypothetical protein
MTQKCDNHCGRVLVFKRALDFRKDPDNVVAVEASPDELERQSVAESRLSAN